MFLGLADQILDQQKPVPNTFCPITHADRKVKAMSIRKVVVNYIKNNRAEFEGWLSYTKTEIEEGSSCMFLGLADQILDQFEGWLTYPSDREFGDDDFFYKY